MLDLREKIDKVSAVLESLGLQVTELISVFQFSSIMIQAVKVILFLATIVGLRGQAPPGLLW